MVVLLCHYGDTKIVLLPKSEPSKKIVALHVLHIVQMVPCEQRRASFMWHCGNVASLQ